MVYYHKCALEYSDPIFSPLPPDVSAWTRLQKCMQKYTLIHEMYPNTNMYFKSKASIVFERKRHLKSKYPCIIHPFSILRACWEVWMCIIFLLSLSYFPWMTAFHCYRYNGCLLFLDIFSWTDIVINFFTGLFRYEYREVILSPKMIARSYLTTYFIFDLLSSMPFDVSSCHYVSIVRLLRIVRLPTIIAYMTTTAKIFRLHHDFFKVVKFNFLVLVSLHWTACIHYIIPKLVSEVRGDWDEKSWIWQAGVTRDDSNFIRYIFCLFRAACCIFCISLPQPLTVEDAIMSWVTFIFGKLFGAYVLVMWLQMFLMTFANEAKHQDIISQLNDYMRSEKLPLDLQKRMLSYYRYRYKEGYFRISAINVTLSDNLKSQISTYCCKNLLENVSIFKDLPDEVLIEISKKMESEIYLPNDIIVKAGSEGRSMYFLASGTVAVFTANGKEVCHLQDGAFFGEIALMVMDHKRIATVIALEICTIYTLDKRHFRKAFEDYPELLLLIEEEANYRMENTIRAEALYKKLLEEPNKRLMLR